MLLRRQQLTLEPLSGGQTDSSKFTFSASNPTTGTFSNEDKSISGVFSLSPYSPQLEFVASGTKNNANLGVIGKAAPAMFEETVSVSMPGRSTIEALVVAAGTTQSAFEAIQSVVHKAKSAAHPTRHSWAL